MAQWYLGIGFLPLVDRKPGTEILIRLISSRQLEWSKKKVGFSALCMSAQKTAAFETTARLYFNGTNSGLTSTEQVSTPKCSTLVTASEHEEEGSVRSRAVGICSIRAVSPEQASPSQTSAVAQQLSYPRLWTRGNSRTHRRDSVPTLTQPNLSHSAARTEKSVLLFSSSSLCWHSSELWLRPKVKCVPRNSGLYFSASFGTSWQEAGQKSQSHSAVSMVQRCRAVLKSFVQ